MMTIYRKRRRGRWIYWTYLVEDLAALRARKWYVTERFARMEVENGNAKLVEVA